MPANRIAAAQRGVAYADVLAPRLKPAPLRKPAKKRKKGARKKAARRRAPRRLTGPLLSPGSLTKAERLRLIDGIEKVLEGLYTHLPLKRARYGFDPVQRLRILRSQVLEVTDDAFHLELADIVTRLRDAHTRYAGPKSLEHKVAALPFLVEMFGPIDKPTYIVTKVGRGLGRTFKPGVVLEYWNGVPLERAVQRHSEREVGGRPDTQRVCAVQTLTLRSLQYDPPPDEHWVVIGYRVVTRRGRLGQAKEITIPWRVVDPSRVERLQTGGPDAKRTAKIRKALRRTRALNPAAAAVRHAKMLLFAPRALVGKQSRAFKREPASRRGKPLVARIIATKLTQTLKAMSIDAPGGPFAYLRIWDFDVDPEKFIKELLRLIPRFPDRGLILDVRGNPGGQIWAAEFALQLFTPNHIEPTRFSALATPFMRQIAGIGDLDEDLGPWRESLDAAVRNGEAYAQPIPISDPASCNDLGQQYGGPVVLVGDASTYSAGDLFSAGFVDNAMGRFLCVGTATGAGGANVWEYEDFRRALAGSPCSLPRLPEGIGLSLSFRRATRSGPMEGIPIEDVGVEGTPYAMTRDDLLYDNRDLLATCIAWLRQQPFSRLSAEIARATRSVRVTTEGLDKVDVLIDGHPGTSTKLAGPATTTTSYPRGTRTIELTGFSGDTVRQRRRLSVRS